jgi:hypothetical protein
MDSDENTHTHGCKYIRIFYRFFMKQLYWWVACEDVRAIFLFHFLTFQNIFKIYFKIKGAYAQKKWYGYFYVYRENSKIIRFISLFVHIYLYMSVQLRIFFFDCT